MKFIRELIASKNWDADDAPEDAQEDEISDAEAPEEVQVEATAQEGSPFFSTDDDDDWLEEDEASEEDRLMDEIAQDLSNEEDEPVLDEAVEEMFADDDDDEEPEDWNIGLSDDDLPPVSQPLPGEPVKFEDEVDDDSDFASFDIGLDDELDEDFLADIEAADEVEAAAVEAVRQDEDLSADEKELLVGEIRNALESARAPSVDDESESAETPKQSKPDLGRGRLLASHTRLLNETEQILDEDDGARRRHAIALMKSAAAATRKDPELRQLSKPNKPDEEADQAMYRNDLADLEPPALGARRKEEHSTTEDDVEPVEIESADAEPEMAEIDSVEEPAELEGAAPEEETEAAEAPFNIAGLRDALVKASDGNSDESAAQPAMEPADTALPDIAAAAAAAWDADAAESAEADPAPVAIPAPAKGRARRQAGRVKTRLIGFQGGDVDDGDPFAKDAATASGNVDVMFPVGWLVVVAGPGFGHSFSLTAGVAQIGRGADQTVRLDFGDSAISRQNHAAVAYDDEDGLFYLGHGGKANLVRLNCKPVLATEELKSGDKIRIGETTLHFVALCSEEFTWRNEGDGDVGTAAIA